MGENNFEEDIRPLSEFCANAASLVPRVKMSGRPFVLTQHGKSAVVLLDVRQYQSMLSSIEQFACVKRGAVESTVGGDINLCP